MEQGSRTYLKKEKSEIKNLAFFKTDVASHAYYENLPEGYYAASRNIEFPDWFPVQRIIRYKYPTTLN